MRRTLSCNIGITAVSYAAKAPTNSDSINSRYKLKRNIEQDTQNNMRSATGEDGAEISLATCSWAASLIVPYFLSPTQ